MIQKHKKWPCLVGWKAYIGLPRSGTGGGSEKGRATSLGSEFERPKLGRFLNILRFV